MSTDSMTGLERITGVHKEMVAPYEKKSPSLQRTLTPAYGRDYRSKPEAIEDFRLGKDFVFNLMGQTIYCGINSYKAGDMVKIRYNGAKDVCFYRITERDLE